MSYHCPRCGFYWCQNQSGTLEEAMAWYREEATQDAPKAEAGVAVDDPEKFPW